MKSMIACGCLALAAGAATAQNGISHGTIFGDVMPQSTVWSTNANGAYYGAGTDHIMVNTTAPTDPTAYLTVNANVAASGWYGAVMESSTATGRAYYKYAAGSDSAIHWFNPDSDTWNLAINGNPTALKIFSGGYTEFSASVDVAGSVFVDDNVRASRYKLNNTRHLNAWVTQYQPFLTSTSGERVYTIDIPNGATVAGATLVAVDNNGTYNYSATLYPTEIDGSLGTAIFTVATSGSAAGQRNFYASTFVDPTIDTINNTYIVVLSNTLGGVPDLSFVTLRVYYTQDEL